MHATNELRKSESKQRFGCFAPPRDTASQTLRYQREQSLHKVLTTRQREEKSCRRRSRDETSVFEEHSQWRRCWSSSRSRRWCRK